MSAPERIWATVNGASTRLPDGGRQLIGGWSEDKDRPRAVEYVRADLTRRQSPAGVGLCASEGCGNTATEYFESGDIGSHYCGDCAAKVRAVIQLSPQAVTDEMVERVLAWVRDDVLPAYGVSHATCASDPEMAEGARATLTAALSGEAHNGQ